MGLAGARHPVFYVVWDYVHISIDRCLGGSTTADIAVAASNINARDDATRPAKCGSN